MSDTYRKALEAELRELVLAEPRVRAEGDLERAAAIRREADKLREELDAPKVISVPEVMLSEIATAALPIARVGAGKRHDRFSSYCYVPWEMVETLIATFLAAGVDLGKPKPGTTAPGGVGRASR